MELCVALDLPTAAANLQLAEALGAFDRLWLKVGFRSYLRDGRSLVDTLKGINPHFKIFLDLKLYDIPNTMADADEEIAMIGVDMFNIHASAGPIAMRAVMERLHQADHHPLVLAVTALTSFDEEHFRQIYGAGIDEKALAFARMSAEAGLSGVVCSAHESRVIKAATRDTFLTLSPGIRPFGEDANDQHRIATLEVAREAEVDFPVIGRPIYRDPDPAAKVRKILEAMG